VALRGDRPVVDSPITCLQLGRGDLDAQLISLKDCTRPLQLTRRVAVAFSVAALACAWMPGSSIADGDPASDVLVTQDLFLPQDAGASIKEAAELSALLRAASRSDFQIRVALIASQADLGSIGELWREPRSYAQYLGQELSLVYTGPLLVVMPDGYGIYRPEGPRPAEQPAVAALGAPGGALASSSITAVQRLAEADGHSLMLPNASLASNPNASDPLAWLVFAIGFALVALTWTLSVRARPFGLRTGARRGAQ
jgi:hypothetical protein